MPSRDDMKAFAVMTGVFCGQVMALWLFFGGLGDRERLNPQNPPPEPKNHR